jgi:hypothetical protein
VFDDFFQYGRCLTEDPHDSNIAYAGGAAYNTVTTSYQMALAKSTDGGLTWPTEVLLGIEGDYRTNCYDIAVAPGDSQVVYAGGEENRFIKVWRSPDGGATWSDVTGNLATLHSTLDIAYALWVSPDDSNTVLAGTTDGVFKTSDGGASWSATGFNYPTRRLVYYGVYDTLYAGTLSYGVYQSENQGGSWQALNNGLDLLQLKCLVLDEKNAFLYAGTNGCSAYRLALPAPPLWVSKHELPASTGGICDFALDATSDEGNRNYFMLGSVTGTEPGLPLPGGMVTLPLNWDPFTDMVISLANSPALPGFHGILSNAGEASAQLNSWGPLPPSAVGVTLYFAYLLYYLPDYYPYDYVSNAVAVEVLP